ncbi:MAG: hydrogenase, partial [Betaproteobacteria bacterium]
MSVAVRQDPQLLDTNPPLIQGGKDFHEVTHDISSITEAKVFETPMKYWIALSITGSVLALLGAMLAYLVANGVGVWGNNRPIGWAWDITNFVFWIGIGHAGTLISAIL